MSARRQRPVRNFGVLGLMAISGCSPFPVEYETEHLLIDVVNPRAELCAGDLRRFEEQIVLLEDVLDSRVRGKLPFQLALTEEDVGCSGSALGCYDRSQDAVYAMGGTWRHEFVHAVWAHGDRSATTEVFFEEGIADLFDGKASPGPAQIHPIEEMYGHDGWASRQLGTHFIGWSAYEFGVEGITALRGADDPSSAYETWTGVSLADAEEAYVENASYAYPDFLGCAEPLQATAPGLFEFSGSTDCSDPAYSSNAFDRMTACRSVLIEQPGVYEFRFSPGGTTTGFVDVCIDTPRDALANPTLPMAIPLFQGSRAVEDGDLIPLDEGRHEICVNVEGQTKQDFLMEVEWVSAVPVAP